jgi:hypothetical protein
MFTDLSGFSRHVAKFGIVHFLQTIYESVRIFVPLIEQHDGVLLKAEADSLLAIFSLPRHALSCAIAMQDATKRYNEDVPPEEQILLGVIPGIQRLQQFGPYAYEPIPIAVLDAMALRTLGQGIDPREDESPPVERHLLGP